MNRVICFVVLLLSAMLAQAANEKMTVQLESFDEVIVYPEHMAPAVIYSEHDAMLRSEQNSRVISVHVAEGDRVSAGDLLIEFACSQQPFNLDALSAQHDLLAAQLDFVQWQQSQNKSLTAQNLSTVEREKSLATEVAVKGHELSRVQAQIAEARQLLSDCSILAPFDGVISKRFIRIGDLASPGASLLSVTDPQKVYLLADLQPQQSALLSEAEQLLFIDRQGSYPISFIEAVPAIDTITGLQPVRFVFSTPLKPLPGSRGRITWRTAVPYLPPAYLRQRNGSLGYFTVEEGVVRFMPVSAAQEGQLAPILERVDSIVVNQLDRLIDGVEVEVVTDRD